MNDVYRTALADLVAAVDRYFASPITADLKALKTARALLIDAPPPQDQPYDWATVALVAQDMRSRGLAEQTAGDELLKLANQNREGVTPPVAVPVAVEGDCWAGMETAVGELVTWSEIDGKRIRARITVLEPCPVEDWRSVARKAADLLTIHAPQLKPPPAATSEAEAAFAAYFRQNYPGPDTVIYNPDWHAPKLFHAAVDAINRYGVRTNRPAPDAVAAERERCQSVCRGMCYEFGAGSSERDVLQRLATRLDMDEFDPKPEARL